jgi:hypothetical protein
MTAVLADDVMDKIADEINSITVDDGTVEYEPSAWTREGRVD